jgi:protein-tyrosine phosphatase
MHLVTEHIAVGNSADMANPPSMMTGVLNVASEIRVEPPAGKVFHWIPFREYMEADPILLDEAVSWLERHVADHRLLICCREGKGRSVSVVVAYLCVTSGMSYQEAVQHLSTCRPGATPLPLLEETILVVRSLRLNRARRRDAGAA